MKLTRQSDCADYESGGQEFESLRARQQLYEIETEFLIDFHTVDTAIVLGSTGAARVMQFR